MILSIDTATLAGSVCLARGENVLASSFGDPGISHSNNLLSHINHVLEVSRVSLSDVDLFAAAAGPGSFTGLRIGLATVKALSQTLRRPCVGIPTLHAIAHSCGAADAIVAALPAGRGEVFAQLLSVASDGAVKELDKASHLSPQNMLLKYDNLPDLKWAGEGAHFHQDKLRDWAAQNKIEFRDESMNGEGNSPAWVLKRREANLAKDIATLALQRLQRNEVDTPESLRAIYVRPADAELKAQWQ